MSGRAEAEIVIKVVMRWARSRRRSAGEAVRPEREGARLGRGDAQLGDAAEKLDQQGGADAWPGATCTLRRAGARSSREQQDDPRAQP